VALIRFSSLRQPNPPPLEDFTTQNLLLHLLLGLRVAEECDIDRTSSPLARRQPRAESHENLGAE
jgi:hypothetical protein